VEEDQTMMKMMSNLSEYQRDSQGVEDRVAAAVSE
jgi:hypothetical protein